MFNKALGALGLGLELPTRSTKSWLFLPCQKVSMVSGVHFWSHTGTVLWLMPLGHSSLTTSSQLLEHCRLAWWLWPSIFGTFWHVTKCHDCYLLYSLQSLLLEVSTPGSLTRVQLRDLLDQQSWNVLNLKLLGAIWETEMADRFDTQHCNTLLDRAGQGMCLSYVVYGSKL